MNKNICYLALIQLCRFAIPLITFPYLARVLNVEGFGYLTFSTAIISYSMIVCQYGFDLTATAKIAQIKWKAEVLNRYVSAVYFSKLFLFFISIFLSLAFLFVNGDKTLIFLTLCMLPMPLGMLITPTWLFQGLELMKQLTLFTIIGRLSVLPLIFLLVKSPGDLYMAGILQSLPFFITSIFCLFYIFNRKIIVLTFVRVKYIHFVLRSGWDVFVTTISSSVYISLFPIVLGTLHGPSSVGYFSVIQNIKNVCTSCFEPIYQVVFPRVNSSIKKDESLSREILRKYFILSAILAIIGGVGTAAFSETVIRLIAGEQYLSVENSVNIIMVAVFFGVVNNYYGVQSLVPTGNSKVLKRIVFSVSCVCLVSIYPVIYMYNYSGAVILLVAIEILVFLLLKFNHYKLGLRLLY